MRQEQGHARVDLRTVASARRETRRPCCPPLTLQSSITSRPPSTAIARGAELTTMRLLSRSTAHAREESVSEGRGRLIVLSLCVSSRAYLCVSFGRCLCLSGCVYLRRSAPESTCVCQSLSRARARTCAVEFERGSALDGLDEEVLHVAVAHDLHNLVPDLQRLLVPPWLQHNLHHTREVEGSA
eukprot:333915-Rhodomonas_salina.1